MCHPCVTRFLQCLKLGRLKAAWDCAVSLRTSEGWSQLGTAALELLDVDMAIAGAGRLESVCVEPQKDVGRKAGMSAVF